MKMDLTKIRNPWSPKNYHTKPFGHIEPNGMNFRHSVKNPNSRLIKMLYFIYIRREVTRYEIITDLFHKTIGQHPMGVTRSWGTYLFTLSNKCGFIKKTRRGNCVYYTLTEKGEQVLQDCPTD